MFLPPCRCVVCFLNIITNYYCFYNYYKIFFPIFIVIFLRSLNPPTLDSLVQVFTIIE